MTPQDPHPDTDRPLTFAGLAATNRERCEAPDGFGHPLSGWSLSDWMLAATGEFGEAANVAKKLNRVRDGIPGNTQTPEELHAALADEFADAVIYLDLAAQHAGINLGEAVVSKFNRTSEKIGAPHRLAAGLTLPPEPVAPSREPWPCVNCGGLLDLCGDNEDVCCDDCDHPYPLAAQPVPPESALRAAAQDYLAQFAAYRLDCKAHGIWTKVDDVLWDATQPLRAALGTATPEPLDVEHIPTRMDGIRWWCSCGAEGEDDVSVLAGWQRHAGYEVRAYAEAHPTPEAER